MPLSNKKKIWTTRNWDAFYPALLTSNVGMEDTQFNHTFGVFGTDLSEADSLNSKSIMTCLYELIYMKIYENTKSQTYHFGMESDKLVLQQSDT